MARVTVEDCVLKIPNRFELVLLAGQRARDVASGSSLTLDRDNDKNPVVALREIAEETVDLDYLRNSLVRGLQKHVEVDEPEDEEIDILTTHELRMDVTQTIADDDLGDDMSIIEDGADAALDAGDDLGD